VCPELSCDRVRQASLTFDFARRVTRHRRSSRSGSRSAGAPYRPNASLARCLSCRAWRLDLSSRCGSYWTVSRRGSCSRPCGRGRGARRAVFGPEALQARSSFDQGDRKCSSERSLRSRAYVRTANANVAAMSPANSRCRLLVNTVTPQIGVSVDRRAPDQQVMIKRLHQVAEDDEPEPVPRGSHS
jgi:hypothetical protein